MSVRLPVPDARGETSDVPPRAGRRAPEALSA